MGTHQLPVDEFVILDDIAITLRTLHISSPAYCIFSFHGTRPRAMWRFLGIGSIPLFPV
jgi:hypothetical protein